MKAFAVNVLFTLFMTYFTMEIYGSIASTALYASLIFAGWFAVNWLFSYFYFQRYFYKLPRAFGLFFFYMRELWSASIKIAYDVVTPTHLMRPAVIAVPLDARTNLEITLLVNFVTLTPGTLSLDISEDKKTLYIHETYVPAGGAEAIINDIKNGFERKILNLTR